MSQRFYEPRVVTLGGFDNVDKVLVGGKEPVTIQTMWKDGIVGVKDDKERLEKIRNQIASLKMLGCDIIRFAVPDMESAESFIEICKSTSVPLVADIHFDYRLALKCLEGPVAAIRINPGNIGSRDRVEAVVNGCREKASR